ncbi:MAG: sugar phosphate isomerase/epimerase family protein [Planctomycetota bacterium]
MQIGVSSYSYSRVVRDGRMTQLEVPAKAKEMGFGVIEFSTFQMPEGTDPQEWARKLRDACGRAGIAITNYTIGADFLKGSGGDWKKEAERLKGELAVAQILGVPGMRHDATGGFPAGHKGGRSFDDALPVLVKGCKAVTEMATDMGIRTMVENHGYFCQDSTRVEKLICGVNHANFGALIDVGNFLCADDEPGRAVGLLAPYAFHVHFKDFYVKAGTAPNPGEGWFMSRGGNFLKGAIVGHGDVPTLTCLRLLKKAGFNGVVSIEFEGQEDPILGIRIGRENLEKYIAMA